MGKRIYISGAITGLHPDLVKRNFTRAEEHLFETGWERIVNPTKLLHKSNQSWEECMLTDIEELFRCDAIFMMRNWRSSRGARIEHAIAKELKLEIMYEQPPSRMWWLKRMIGRKEQEVQHAA
jgi:hypothetical protein